MGLRHKGERGRMNLSMNLVIAVFLLVDGTPSMAYAGKSLAEKLEDKYFSLLDGWVERGGKVNEYKGVVLETCGKLVIATANASEAVAFTTTQKEEFDFRVDICAKTTVHRVHPQSEFDDPKLIQMICGDGTVLIQKLCKRSGLR